MFLYTLLLLELCCYLLWWLLLWWFFFFNFSQYILYSFSYYTWISILTPFNAMLYLTSFFISIIGYNKHFPIVFIVECDGAIICRIVQIICWGTEWIQVVVMILRITWGGFTGSYCTDTVSVAYSIDRCWKLYQSFFNW